MEEKINSSDKKERRRPFRRSMWKRVGEKAVLRARVHQLEIENALLNSRNVELEHKVRHDLFLTTLLHKQEFIDTFAEKIDKNKDSFIGLFFIDINNFKVFNDTNLHGKDGGDGLLKFVEERLNDLFKRDDDEIFMIDLDAADKGRMGGDEIAISVVLKEGDKRAGPREQMIILYQRLRSLEEDIAMNYQYLMPEGVPIGLSIGSALYNPFHPLDAHTLIDQADEAMYEEKPTKD